MEWVSLIISVIAVIIAVFAFCLQWKGNELANKIKTLGEKISKHQDRIEFFQKKNHVTEQVNSLNLSQENSTNLVSDIELIFENEFHHIVVKDTTGDSFPKFSMNGIKVDEIDNFLNELKHKLIKIQFKKIGNNPYALPDLLEDYDREMEIILGNIKSAKEKGYYWKNNQIKGIPGFLCRIQKIGQNDSNKITLINDRQGLETFDLYKNELYALVIHKSKNNAVKWMILNIDESEAGEFKFVHLDKLEENVRSIKLLHSF